MSCWRNIRSNPCTHPKQQKVTHLFPNIRSDFKRVTFDSAHICSLSTSDLTNKATLDTAHSTPKGGLTPSCRCNCFSSMIYEKQNNMCTDGTEIKLF